MEKQMSMKKNEQQQKDSSDKSNKKVSITIIIYGAIILLALLFVSFVGAAYLWKGNTGTVIGGTLSKIVPLPAAVVNYTNFVTMQDLQNDLAALRSFYENQNFSSVGMMVDFSTADGKKRLQIVEKQLLNKLIEDKAIKILAEKRGIHFSVADSDQAVSKKLEEYGVKEDAESDLQKRYGWTMDDFRQRVVLPSMYQEALTKKASEELEGSYNEASDKIKKAQAELLAGKAFSDVAHQYSEGSSATDGGELGWVRSDQLLPEISQELFGGKLEKYEIIQSRLGFHIFEVEDKKKDGDQDVVRVRQVFVKTKTFADWLGEQMKNMDIFVPERGLYWDSNSVGVQFSDQSMRDFEKNARENNNGDPSLLF